jgi:putative two-component system response regulator
MPGESGLELAGEILARRSDLAVVMVSAADDVALAENALALGAYGYVLKPFTATEVYIAVANALRRRRLEIENREHRDKLERLVAERTAALESARAETIYRLARAAEFRDLETGEHIERVSRYCALVAGALGLPARECELLRLASPLHDIGKIAVPDHVLRKPGGLTQQERRLIESHAELGHQMLAGSEEPLLELAATLALTHHERYDGSGYPRGLAGESIPLVGRIIAVADVFDALASDRVYRRAMPLEQVLAQLRDGRGSQFDPRVLDAFLAVLPDVLAVRTAFAESAAAQAA